MMILFLKIRPRRYRPVYICTILTGTIGIKTCFFLSPFIDVLLRAEQEKRT